MLFFLPPSEGKTAPASGPKLNLPKLSFSSLNFPRQQVMGALQKLGAGPQAAAILKLGPQVEAEAAWNTRLKLSPCAPANQVYTGVLYEAAKLAALPPDLAKRAAKSIWIFSGLWGVVSPADTIPAYRCPMDATLPDLGTGDRKLAAFWRDHLSKHLAPLTAGELILDCRSSAYVEALRPADLPQAELVTLGAVVETAGKRKTVSHHAKHWRGLLSGLLLADPTPLPANADELFTRTQDLVSAHGLSAEFSPATAKKPAALTLVIPG